MSEGSITSVGTSAGINALRLNFRMMRSASLSTRACVSQQVWESISCLWCCGCPTAWNVRLLLLRSIRYHSGQTTRLPKDAETCQYTEVHPQCFFAKAFSNVA